MVIQFICRGNAFRSIIAEAYLKSLDIPDLKILSSGTVAGNHKESNAKNFPKTIALLESHNLKQFAKDHYADDLDQSKLDKTDIAVVLNKRAYDEAVNLYMLPAETYVWDVTDIGEEGRIANNENEWNKYMEEVYQEIVKNVDDLVAENKLQP